jgi:hypothetical protein
MIHTFVSALLQKKSYVVVLYLLTAAYVFAVWVWSADTPTTSFNGDPVSKLSDIIYGRAHKPYVHRVLLPLATRAVYAAVAGPALDSLEQRLLRVPALRKQTDRLGWETDFFFEYLIALSLAFVCLAGFAFVVRTLWSTLYSTEQRITNLVPLLALLALPPLFPTGPHYIYDFPALFFFTLGLTLLVQRRWRFFYPVFITGILNKETIILLSVLFALLYWRTMPRRTFLLHLGTQTILFLIIKTFISDAFAGNGGNVMDFHLHLNIHIALMGYSLPTLFIVCVLIWLVFHEYASKHPVLKRSLLLALPFCLLLVWGGVITELRDLYELYPIVLFLVLHTVLFSLFKIPYYLQRLPLIPLDRA